MTPGIMRALNQGLATCQSCRPTLEWLKHMSEIHPAIGPEVQDLLLKAQWLETMAGAGQSVKDAIEEAERNRNA